MALGLELRLDKLEKLFALDRFEVDILLVSLAVELDLRYERLYAYLQDDVTKKHPSVDLVLNLLTSTADGKFAARHYFDADASLFRHHLAQLHSDPSQPLCPELGQYIKIDNRIVHYLLGSDALDDSIVPYAAIPSSCNDPLTDCLVSKPAVEDIQNFIEGCGSERTIFYLHGPYGTGKQTTALAVSDTAKSSLLVVDIKALALCDISVLSLLLVKIQREAKIQGAAIYWKDFDTLLAEKHIPLLDIFTFHLRDRPVLTFLAGNLPWVPTDGWRPVAFASIEMPTTGFSERIQIWKTIFYNRHLEIAESDVSAIATKFKFTGGQILDVANTVANLSKQRRPGSAEILPHELYEACRLHSNQRLAALAHKISPKYTWSDIVLPSDHLEQLHEICNHALYRERVYGEWGFDLKLSMGKGLSVLFSGPSGTGKTMAAEIIAGALGLELYKIDLAAIVSKYIGETEKNLSKIFTEAETSNAILFFDEADALFGKRSDVKDSHDRYANIETGYLLQRMEEYEGVVILATNFSKNMDDAFVRRLHFTVEFPFPDNLDRLQIWKQIWPKDTPLDGNLDLNLLASRFEITGGNIRNIALAAAFLAADNGSLVNMDHLLRATKREYQKMGKVIVQDEFNMKGSVVQ